METIKTNKPNKKPKSKKIKENKEIKVDQVKVFDDSNYIKELELKAKENLKNWNRQINIENKRDRTRDILKNCYVYGDLIKVDFKNKVALDFRDINHNKKI